MRLIYIEPSYGYGWVPLGESRVRDTPAPFQVRLTDLGDGEWSGIVETLGHEFDGLKVHLSQRHRTWEGTVNVDVEGAAFGWGTVNNHGSLPGRD